MGQMGKQGGNTMKISVIISTYKRPERLKKAIQSVLDQSFTDWELIVVDDASKDETESVVTSFKDPRIVYIKRTKNSGCDVIPKNEGAKASQGEYIAFLDDDNTYRMDHLAVLYNEIIKTKVDVVYGDRWLVDETNRIKPQIGVSLDFDPLTLMQRNFIDTSDALMKKQALFDVGGFDEKQRKYIDWNLWVRMLKYGKIFKRIPLVITDYHLHEDMKSEKVHTKGDRPDAFVPEWSPHDCIVELPYLRETREPKVAVYSITYDRLDYTKKSFDSLRRTAGYEYDHFVIDNGSKDGTKDYLIKEHAEKRIARVKINDSNEGISKASNDIVDIIKECGYDIVVKWDNDCIGLTKGWLEKMITLWKSNHLLALSCYVQGLLDNPGGAPRVAFGTICGEYLGLTRHLGGICHFVDIHGYENFHWDNDSFLHGIQDMEFSQWLLFHGYTMAYLENHFVSHGPQGTEAQKKEFPEYFERRKSEKQTRYEENK